MKKYQISGMSCVVCSRSIEETAKNFPGIEEAKVNFATENLTIKTNSNFDEEAFIKLNANLGYGLSPIGGVISQSLKVGGMTCVMCSRAIEVNLREAQGVEEVYVNFASEEVRIKFDPAVISLDSIEKIISSLGYTVIKEKKKRNKDLIKLISSLSVAALLMFISMGPMMGIKLPPFMAADSAPLTYALIQMILAISGMIIGYKFYTRGYRNLFKLQPNMDSLVALGTSAAFLYSVYSLILIIGGDIDAVHHLYFEATGVIIALILLGKFLEARSKGKAKDALDRLANLAPEVAMRKVGESFVQVSVRELNVGDIIIVKAGEQIPTDGQVIDGAGAVDESMLTGESIPVDKFVNSSVVGASICLNGYLLIRVTSVGSDTILAKMIDLVEEAQNSKAPIARLADKVAGVFVPIVLAISIIAGIIWYLVSRDFGFTLKIMVSILVIACPCSLGLATPIAIIVGTGLGASNGILIKNAEILEETHKVKVVALDKTGTITSGEVRVVDVLVEEGFNKANVLAIMASIEAHSSHPLAKAIIDLAAEEKINYAPVDDFVVYEGQGLGANLNETSYLLGNMTLVQTKTISQKMNDYLEEALERGYTLIILANSEKVIAFASIADTIKESSYIGVKQLKSIGLEVALISGDHEKASRQVAKELGIDLVYAGVLPGEKAQVIQELKEKHGKVAMVGDGINDSVALTQADIGIALASGTQIAMSSADIVLMKSDLRDVALAIHLSKKTIKNIKENLFWAFAYNVIGIPIAAGVLYPAFGILLNPMLAALAMAFSSVTVVLNALRLRRVKLK